MPGVMPASVSCSSLSWRCVELAGCRTQVRISATCTCRGHHLQAVDETGPPGIAAALEREGDDAAASPWADIFRPAPYRGCPAARGSRRSPPCRGRPGRSPRLRHCGSGVPCARQGLQALIDVEGALRRLAAAQIAHELHAGLDDEGRLAEGLGINEAMVGGVRLGEFGEAPGSPVELAAVHDDAAHLQGVAVHILGGGVDDDVGTEIRRDGRAPAWRRCCPRSEAGRDDGPGPRCVRYPARPWKDWSGSRRTRPWCWGGWPFPISASSAR